MKNCFRTREIGFVIFLAALAFRAVYYMGSGANPLLRYPVLDESYYIELGSRIASGFWLGENRAFFMDPLYGYVLGLVFALFGQSLEAVRILQMLLDSTNAVMIFFIGARLWNRTAGIVSGLLYAAYKVSFFHSLLILKTTLSITLSLVFLISLLHVVRADRASRWFFLGLLAAIMVYLHANFLVLVPMAVVLYWFIERPKPSHFFVRASVFMAGVVIMLSIGAFRNYKVSGEWAWLNTQSGRLLYCSNNPQNLTGRYNVPAFARAHPEESELDFQREAERRSGRPLSVGEVSSYWTEQTWNFLKSQPRAVITLLENKLLGTVSNYEIPVNHSYYTSARISGFDRLPLPTFAWVFALGAPGLALGVSKRKEILWLLMPIAAVLITVMLFYTSSRFRMPAIPFLTIGAGIGVDFLVQWIRKGQRLKMLALLLTFLLLSIASFRGVRPPPNGTEEFYLAKAYWSQGRYDAAWERARRGAVDFPDQARFQVLLGMIALSEGRYEEAVRYSRRASEIDPKNADALHNLGLAWLLTGKAVEAIGAVQKAISLTPEGRYFFTLAKAKEACGQKEEAIGLFKEYLKRAKLSDPFRQEAEKSIQSLGEKGA